jgi:hypothetical protein
MKHRNSDAKTTESQNTPPEPHRRKKFAKIIDASREILGWPLLNAAGFVPKPRLRSRFSIYIFVDTNREPLADTIKRNLVAINATNAPFPAVAQKCLSPQLYKIPAAKEFPGLASSRF